MVYNMSFGRWILRHDVKSWLKEHQIKYRESESSPGVIIFESEHDQAIFKLTWL